MTPPEERAPDGTVVRLYDGWHFALTPDQIEQIRPAINEAAKPEHQGEAAMIGQVWSCVDGVFCVVRVLSRPMAHAIRDCLLADKIVTVRVDATKEPTP